MKTGAGGALAVSVSDGRSKIDNLTRAFVGTGANFTVRDLTVESQRTSRASGSMDAGAGGAVTVTTGGAITEIDGTVESYVGPATGSTAGAGTTTVSASGAINVLARSSSVAVTTGGGGSGGGITISAFTLDSKTLGTTRAFVGDGVTVVRAGSLDVDAEVVGARAQTTLQSASGGAITIQSVNAKSMAKPSVGAWIGNAVIVGDLADPDSPVAVAGDIDVTAIGRAEADSVGNVFGGGLAAIGVPQATVEVDPTVDAHIGTAPATTPTRIYTNGSVRVRAELTRAGAVVPSDLLTAVDLTGETFTFTYPGIGEGSTVVFSAANAASTPGGLTNGAVYTVLDAGANTIRLGSLFDVSGIDPLTETITFAGGHPYKSGDCVYYDPGNSSSIIAPWQGDPQATGGCSNTTASSADRVFYVRVIDGNTIKLTTTLAAATGVDDAPYSVTLADGTHLQLSETDFDALVAAGLAAGSAIIYRSPTSASFTNGFVDVSVVDVTITDDNGNSITVKAPATGSCDPNTAGECGNTVHADNDNIFVGTTAWAGFSAGQPVTYRSLDGVNIGLTNGATYYVIKGTTNDGTIRLADELLQCRRHRR